jgi:hypothetical protein
MLPKSFDKHETKFALFLAWILSPCLLSLLGFYLGTIFGNREHKVDLQVADIHVGRQYAAVFFCVSLVFAVIATIVVPKVVEKDYADREARWANQGHDHH